MDGKYGSKEYCFLIEYLLKYVFLSLTQFFLSISVCIIFAQPNVCQT